ncbi:uncharacterized protein C21orf58-like [Lynx canadensis]|uniref:uncharacterized protein C21orf58-like n=1 Tax=Lynx canadensis TaxID=61383 RepID=UPI0013C4EB1F|nr:uncharacterized protein C21orf58-like [Lynx canadensis]
MMTISMAKSSKHTHGLENRMLDSSVADEMTGLTLKLWEKKLEQEPKRVEGDSEDPHLRPGNEGRPDWSALSRKKEFPQSTFQHLLEEVSQAQGNGCQQRRSPPHHGPLPASPCPHQAWSHQGLSNTLSPSLLPPSLNSYLSSHSPHRFPSPGLPHSKVRKY